MTYTNKTQPTTINPQSFLKENFPDNENLQKEAELLIDLYCQASGSPCVMWNKIFGFGKYHYLDSKGGQHEYLLTGFAISKTGFTLYNMIGWANYQEELKKLGKCKLSGKSCLSIKSVDDIDLQLLQTITRDSITVMKKKYQTEK